MSSRNRLALRLVFSAITLSALALLAGCGSSSNTGKAPPTGGFSNSDLNGTYVFSTSGSDMSGYIMSFAGTFTANGSGSISSGALDMVDPTLTPFLQGQAITGGSYNVGADGRPKSQGGLLTLVTSAGTFTFDFVLSSSSGGQITYYSSNGTYGGTGSGNFELASTISQSNIDGQAYTFNVSGDSVNASTGAQYPFASVGTFTLDSNGQIGITTTGVHDVNNNITPICGAGTACTITSGSVSVAATPGTATITSSAGTFQFDVYPIDATHFKLIETDGLTTSFFTAGDAYNQSTSIQAGNNVFAAAGYDYSVQGPITAAGLWATDSNGDVTNASTEDYNDAGTANEVTGYTGTYSTVTGGRSLVTLTGFVKGDNGLGCTNCEFAAYPSTGGLQFLEVDGAGFLDGSAGFQNSTTFASGDGYGMDVTGLSNSAIAGEVVEEDDIAEFTNTSGALAGLVDFNDIGSLAFAYTYSASYAADTTGISGRGTIAGTLTSSSYQNSYDMAIYVVDTSTAVGIVQDSNMVALGTLDTQASTSSGNSAERHVSAFHMPPRFAKPMKEKRYSK